MKKRWFSYALAACLSISVALILVGYLKYQAAYDEFILDLTERSELQLELTEQRVQDTEKKLNTATQLLTQGRSLFNFVTQPNEIDRRHVQETWQTIISYQPAFRKIRFIDNDGLELIKSCAVGINASESYERVFSQRYFKQALSVAPGKTLTLGAELENIISEPYVPVMRTILPYYLEGQREGFVVIDLNPWQKELLPDFKKVVDDDTQILTMSGDYLVHPNPSILYGFSLPSRHQFNISLTHPELWQTMHTPDKASYMKDGTLYVFRKLMVGKLGEHFALIEIPSSKIEYMLKGASIAATQQTILLIVLVMMLTLLLLYVLKALQRKSLDNKLALAALNGMSAVLICDKKYLVHKVNKEFESITGYREKQIRYGNAKKLLLDRRDSTQWHHIWESVRNDRFWEGELAIRGRGGIKLTTITRIQAVSGSEETENYIVSIVDISERKELEERLRYLSERDSLTQLWNRRKFDIELRNQAVLTERYPDNHIGCLALVDIDHFKKINDEQGHDVGDVVIKRVATTLMNETRRTDFVARIGGEEFAIIMPHTELQEAESVLERVRASVSQDEGIGVTISIGLTDMTSEFTHTYKCADIALYESKSLGRNKVSVCQSTNDFA